MISKVVLRNFKRFEDQTFELDSHMVFAGPNNSGKTTVLQAIAAWKFALSKWPPEGGRKKSKGWLRTDFSPVPLQEFAQLWAHKSTYYRKRDIKGKEAHPRPLEIAVHGQRDGCPWQLTMEFGYVNKDQVYFKPKIDGAGGIDEAARELKVAYIPSFSGISLEEKFHTPAYQDMLIGQGKLGDILRNLLLQVSKDEDKGKWDDLCKRIREIFQCELLPPVETAFILCEYHDLQSQRKSRRKMRLDINTAGSGFQQVLLLLAFLYARPASVLLIDEPDAHLHVNLQGRAYRLLREIARERNGQLIIATHSEVLIKSTQPNHITSFFGKNPKILATAQDRDILQYGLKELDGKDLLDAEQAGNRILFLEGQSDYAILKAWAEVLEHPPHPLRKWFADNTAYWRDMQGVGSWKVEFHHFQALRQCHPEMKGFMLLDADAKKNCSSSPPADSPTGMRLERWRRYEIENYLIHPEAIRRFIKGEQARTFAPQLAKAEQYMKDTMGRGFFSDPLNYDLEAIKASERFFRPMFNQAGGTVYKRDLHKLAAAMRPEELHGDVRDMLDAIAEHFGL